MVDYAVMNQLLFEGKHKIVKEMTEQALQQMGAALPDGDDTALRSFEMVLDPKTNFPRSMQVGGEQPMMTVKFGEVSFLDSVDDKEFDFTPPDGVPLIDLGAAPPNPTGG